MPAVFVKHFSFILKYFYNYGKMVIMKSLSQNIVSSDKENMLNNVSKDNISTNMLNSYKQNGKNSVTIKRVSLAAFFVAVLLLLLSFALAFSTFSSVAFAEDTGTNSGTTSGTTAGTTAGTTTGISAKKILPINDYELSAINNPESVATDGNNIAILYNTNHVFTVINGSKKDIAINVAKPSKLWFYNGDILCLDTNAIAKLDLKEGVGTKLKLEGSGDNIGCQAYAVCGDKIATVTSGKKIIVYGPSETETGSFVELVNSSGKKDFDVLDEAPIAINSNYIFTLTADKKIVRYNHLLESKKVLSDLVVNTNAMVADDNYLYYIEDNEIKKMDIVSGEKSNDFMPEDTPFELGKITTPSAFCLKGESLLIADTSINAVSEFKTGETLEFTGFAIASGKTAYNRIGVAEDVSRYKDKIGILSAEKITVITLSEDFDGYNKEYFNNMFIGESVGSFSVGNSGVLCALEDGKLKYQAYTDKEPKAIETSGGSGIVGSIKYITYQSGSFYLLTSDGAKYYAFGLNEDSLKELTKDSETGAFVGAVFNKIGETTSDTQAIAVDVYGNLTFSQSGYKKIEADLKGDVYGLNLSGELGSFTKEGGSFSKLSGVSAIAFTLDFDIENVYYTTVEREYLYSTTALNNYALSKIHLPDDYKTQGQSAFVVGTVESVSVCKVKTDETVKNVNAYSFEIVENGGVKKVKFSDLATLEEEYIPIAKRDNMYFCAGKNGVVIIDEKGLDFENRELTVVKKTFYVSTGVHAYYIPIITKNNIYSVVGNDGAEITLSKGTEIFAEKKVEILGREFYLAVSGENSYFIPCGFVSEGLVEIFEYIEFSSAKLKKTTIYSDENMTESLISVAKNTKVNVLAKSGDKYKVELLQGGETYVGYVYKKDILDESKLAIRNVLVVLAFIACVCGTISLFVLKGKS